MIVPFIDLNKQYSRIENEITQAIESVLASSRYILGPDVSRFEEEFASFCQTKYAVAVANGTDALTLTLQAFGIKEGDEVILPANTFIATAEAIVNAGGTPVLIDADPQDYSFDVGMLEQTISGKTKAIVPVHLYGHPVNMIEVMEVADKHDLFVIEDAAQAHGAEFAGKKIGSIGHAASFSFYPSKNLGAFGDAGAVVTDDKRLTLKIRMLGNHGGVEKYQHAYIGHNSRMDSIQAAILSVKLKYLELWNQKRRDNAHIYNELLADNENIRVPPKDTDGKSVYHLYVIRVLSLDRDELRAALRESGIQTGIHYPTPIHLTPSFEFLGYKEGNFPVAEGYAKSILSLPMCPELNKSQVEYVAGKVNRFFDSRFGN